jgi:hypothetical protein
MLILSGVWKKLIPALMDNFGEVQAVVEEVMADVVGGGRVPESLVEPESLQSHVKLNR